MPIPANQVTHVEIKIAGLIASGGSNTKNTFTTFHFRRTSTINPIDKAHVDTAFQAAIVAKILLALNNRWGQLNNRLRWLNDALDPELVVTHANPGAVAGDGMPSVNYVFSLMWSGLRGGSYRSNYKLGPLSESNTTAGTDDILNAGAITLFGNVGTAVLAGFTDADGNIWVPSVVSRRLSQFRVNPTTVISNDCIQVKVNKRIGRLKQREPASVY
jgi:hypothetical protein